MRTTQQPLAAWRVLYRLRSAADGDPWLADGDYTHEESVKRVFEIRANTEEGEYDSYTKPVSFV